MNVSYSAYVCYMNFSFQIKSYIYLGCRLSGTLISALSAQSCALIHSILQTQLSVYQRSAKVTERDLGPRISKILGLGHSRSIHKKGRARSRSENLVNSRTEISEILASISSRSDLQCLCLPISFEISGFKFPFLEILSFFDFLAFSIGIMPNISQKTDTKIFTISSNTQNSHFWFLPQATILPKPMPKVWILGVSEYGFFI